MAVHSRNLLLFLALAGIAILTWIQSREPEDASEESSQTAREPQGYSLIDAVMQATDDRGRIFYRIYADQVRQLPGSEDFELEDMRVEYLPESGIQWEVSAATGFLPGDRSFMKLRDVRLSRAAGDNAGPATLETSELRLDIDKREAVASQPVVFHTGAAEIQAPGMTLNIETNVYTLDPNAKIRF